MPDRHVCGWPKCAASPMCRNADAEGGCPLRTDDRLEARIPDWCLTGYVDFWWEMRWWASPTRLCAMTWPS